jgi:hypothetical protein
MHVSQRTISNRCITYKKKTKDEDYEFPMQIPYTAKVQDKDKLLMKELMKSDHTYELTKITLTAVMTLNGKYLS